MSTNNKISLLIERQSPFFVRNDDPKFIAFVEAYYEYLEQANTVPQLGKVVERAKNLSNYMDVDTTLSFFVDHLYKKFLVDFPADTLADKTEILKHAKDFYRAKGTEKSFKFLMRALYDEEIELYYPKADVLKASDGKWYIQKSLRIANTAIDGVANTNVSGNEKFIGILIEGASSNADAVVEGTDRFFLTGAQVDEISLSNIVGTFQDGEQITGVFTQDGATHNISATVYGSSISSITINSPGSKYNIGDPAVIISSTGSGAAISVAQVSRGNIAAIGIVDGGVGYQNSNYLLFTAGGGSGANAQVVNINTDERYHPNTYNIWISLISSEANTNINNSIYSNLNASIVNPMNSAMSNTWTYFVYGNTGPAKGILVLSTGGGYLSVPGMGIIANTRILELGILGKMNVVNRGTGYANGDTITFTNITGGYGVGALANVTSVAANGMIKEVKFQPRGGFLTGGSGYDQNFLPIATINTAAGIGASIIVESTLGHGGSFTSANSTIGAIERIVITNRGSGYTVAPTIDMTGHGDGTAQVSVAVIAGVYNYPGRYLNDDGMLSTYNFLQDRDYYQNYSYVIRVKESIENYRRIFRELVHPAGMKMWGEYRFVDEDAGYAQLAPATDTTKTIYYQRTYTANANVINISFTSHGLSVNANVRLGFTSNSANANLSNGIYRVSIANTNFFRITTITSANNVNGNVDVGILTSSA